LLACSAEEAIVMILLFLDTRLKAKRVKIEIGREKKCKLSWGRRDNRVRRGELSKDERSCGSRLSGCK